MLRPVKSSRWRAHFPLRDRKPFAAHTSCVLLAARHPRCGRCGRCGEEPLDTLCRAFRAAELCDAGRMLSAAGDLPRSEGALGVVSEWCWRRFASPSSLRFLPGQPQAASLPYPSGTHNTSSFCSQSQVTLLQQTVSSCLRGGVVSVPASLRSALPAVGGSGVTTEGYAAQRSGACSASIRVCLERGAASL